MKYKDIKENTLLITRDGHIFCIVDKWDDGFSAQAYWANDAISKAKLYYTKGNLTTFYKGDWDLQFDERTNDLRKNLDRLGEDNMRKLIIGIMRD